ncbi:oligopeptidase A [Pseudohalioglobus lutimaris]|uniref:oligopeptidase A n=1 Tax=Pseudohalioglobus lutimaris TaxID=1737061 RepID=A0A2N5X5P1_9GAMM|nr:oligopeptidase A [Pseudohalioglobus lutimaris]PLW69798.1 oligopeptidase A [Pseudohalioglobus lutimaris]
MSNTLIQSSELPQFSRIDTADVEPTVRKLIERNKAQVELLLNSSTHYTAQNLLDPIEELDDELTRAFSPVSHLNSVLSSDELRAAYNACLPLLSEYGTWMGQHEALYHAYQQLADNSDAESLDNAQRKALTNALRDFRLAGVALPGDEKKHFGALQKRLSELSSKFRDNVLDATNAWSRRATKAELAGVPDTALAGAKQAAEQAGVDGYLINLEFPSYFPVLTYCDNADLRREVYEANATRASDQGPHAGQWDNAEVMVETLELRRELAQLLGFENYTELSLATKMADTPAQVVGFLEELTAKSRQQALREWQDLQDFAREEFGAQTVNAWDVGYYSEKLRQQRYQISQEDIRPYLPADKALSGLFAVVERLYGIHVEEELEFDNYHPDVKLFNLLQDGELIARFYLDLYARPHKQGGAWMDGCRIRRLSEQQLQLPVAYLVCNFSPPVGDQPALLTHNELTTLFHEFGHGLHHMLTQQTVAAVSGINGVPWDAVELPSQFLENWCWEPEALAFISGHHETGEPLPGELLDNMLAARNFQSGMQMARQLEFSLFDFLLHMNWSGGDAGTVQSVLNEVRSRVGVVPIPGFNRFQNSFSHIFGGGYAAGYYSYKWAEVLSADAYSRFEEDGIFNQETGADFRREILEAGGSREPMEAFIAFRGREPDIAPLLRHCGIAA